jgi:superfamily II DNA/RNA helicase
LIIANIISALLRELLGRKSNKGVRTVIFMNAKEPCKKIYQQLKTCGYSVVQINSAVDAKVIADINIA